MGQGYSSGAEGTGWTVSGSEPRPLLSHSSRPSGAGRERGGQEPTRLSLQTAAPVAALTAASARWLQAGLCRDLAGK